LRFAQNYSARFSGTRERAKQENRGNGVTCGTDLRLLTVRQDVRQERTGTQPDLRLKNDCVENTKNAVFGQRRKPTLFELEVLILV
jgi:hypothetical protein